MQERIGVRFRRPELLRQAMTHASWTNERGGPSGPGHDNERLEYLGDAVLELVVGEYLYRRFPDYDEGQLTQLRAALVNTASLARLAERLRLGEALRVGKGAAKTGAQRLPSLLANAFEAMIGAIFLDQGYRVATRVFVQNIGDLADWTVENFKGRLQEVAQERLGNTPTYRVSAVEGHGHRRRYRAEALVGGEVLGSGIAATKQSAEQLAAREALHRLLGDGGMPAEEVAATAAGAARRAASEAAGETVRARRRIAEAAADTRAATTATVRQPRRRAAGGAPAGSPAASPGENDASPIPVAPAASPSRRRGLLGALARAAEVLVGRPLAGGAGDTSPASPTPAQDVADPGVARRSRRGRRGRRGGRPAAATRSPARGETRDDAAVGEAGARARKAGPRTPGRGSDGASGGRRQRPRGGRRSPRDGSSPTAAGTGP